MRLSVRGCYRGSGLQIENVIAGLLVGTLVGLTGVGGGSLMAPVLILVFGVAPATAVGTDLWFAAATKAVGGAIYHRHGAIDGPVLGRLALGSVPAALATLFWLSRFDAGLSALLLRPIGVAIVGAGAATIVLTLLRPRIVLDDARTRPGRLQTVLTIVLGALLGVLVTLTSVGAGALGAILLLMIYPRRLSPARLVGTDIAHAIPLTLLAGGGHLLMGHIDFHLLGQLLIGSVPGVVLGAVLTKRLPARPLRALLGTALVAVGVKMLA